MEAAEERKGLLESNPDDDGESIHSFASSSTLTPPTPLTPSIDEDEKFCPPGDEPIFTATQPSQQSWLKTPLTPAGITTLFLRLLSAVTITLLPSPLQPLLTTQARTPRKLHATSYLDGLRGVAALIVLHSHFLTNWFYPLRSGYLSSETDTYVLQLPILRLFYSGRASVSVFFVVSGFALSYKPLSLLRKPSTKARVLEVLSSSVFRRFLRLWMPIVLGTFISALLANYELYTPVPSRGEIIPPTFPTLREQLWDWWVELSAFWFPWRSVDGNAPEGIVYNGHLWTIPVEFYGSFVVFASVLGMSSVRKAWVRLVLGLGLMGWSLRGGRWDVALFLGGVVCAEWSLMLGEWKEVGLPIHVSWVASSNNLVRVARKAFSALYLAARPFKTPAIALSLLTSLFLLSYAGESASPGHFHAFLIPYTPSIFEPISLGHEHFWLCIGALLLLFTLTSSPFLQKPFTWSFPQYLGDISYSLYIVHGMVLFTLGTAMQERWTGIIGEQKWVDNGMGELVEVVVAVEPEARVWWNAFWGAAAVDWLVVFWAADLFWRVCDRRVPGWGRWVEGFVGR